MPPSRPSPHRQAPFDARGRDGQVDRRTALAAAERVRVLREQIEAARERHRIRRRRLASRRTGLRDRRQPPCRRLAYRLFVFLLPFCAASSSPGSVCYSDATDQEADELAERRWRHRRIAEQLATAASDTARWWVVVITVPILAYALGQLFRSIAIVARPGVRRVRPRHAGGAALGGPVRRGDPRTVRGHERRRCAPRALAAGDAARRPLAACALAALWIGVTGLLPARHGPHDESVCPAHALRGRNARAVCLRHASHRLADRVARRHVRCAWRRSRAPLQHVSHRVRLRCGASRCRARSHGPTASPAPSFGIREGSRAADTPGLPSAGVDAPPARHRGSAPARRSARCARRRRAADALAWCHVRAERPVHASWAGCDQRAARAAPRRPDDARAGALERDDRRARDVDRHAATARLAGDLGRDQRRLLHVRDRPAVGCPAARRQPGHAAERGPSERRDHDGRTPGRPPRHVPRQLARSRRQPHRAGPERPADDGRVGALHRCLRPGDPAAPRERRRGALSVSGSDPGCRPRRAGRRDAGRWWRRADPGGRSGARRPRSVGSGRDRRGCGRFGDDRAALASSGVARRARGIRRRPAARPGRRAALPLGGEVHDRDSSARGRRAARSGSSPTDGSCSSPSTAGSRATASGSRASSSPRRSCGSAQSRGWGSTAAARRRWHSTESC